MWKHVCQMAAVVGLAAGMASSQSFSGFTAGNIVVSRSVYTGSVSTLAVAQPLPPVCPTTAACGTVKASANGAYPGVFANDVLDGNFGITSPLFLDQLTPTGTLASTLAIPTSMVTTSFSSKSEVALNLSADGAALTFMAYVAPPNSVDVSNSNTPMAYDATNPVGTSYYRGVVQVGANGAIQVTPTNSYSGNNGRAAILANGLYYMAGNGNNGSGTPANIIVTEGIQLAVPGQSAATPAIPVAANFTISQVTNPATGLPYPPDKAGKDNNFRGLTMFNNTLYTTKGSGSNGLTPCTAWATRAACRRWRMPRARLSRFCPAFQLRLPEPLAACPIHSASSSRTPILYTSRTKATAPRRTLPPAPSRACRNGS
jgi:hypothetical protein